MKTTRQVAKELLWEMLILLFTLAPVNWAVAQTCVQPPSGLVSWWPGDGNANDIQGNNPGMLLNGATFAAGNVGQAFSFDGVNDEVIVPYAANLNPTEALTLDAWVNLDSLSNDANGGYQAVVAMSEGQRAYWLGITGTGSNHIGTAGNVHLEGSGLGEAWITSAAAITPGQWYHIAGVIEPSANRFEIYVNGVLQPVVSSNGGPQLASVSNVPFRIGFSDPGSPYHFNGLIDEVEFYNRALTATEILAIFAAGSAGKCKDTTLLVEIDIKPGSFPNCFNVNGNGVIPVALLGSPTFDVTQVDTSSLNFAGLEVRVKANGALQCSYEDVSGDFTNPEGAPDGVLDLVCQFVDDTSNWAPNEESTATLTGLLLDGTPIEGTDSICVVP